MIVIGLDTGDPKTLRRHIAAGRLPALAKVLGRAREVATETEGDLFLSGAWPSFASGLSVGNHGIHSSMSLKSGTLEIAESGDYQAPAPFWEMAARAGVRTCVLDPPFYAPPPPSRGYGRLRFLNWGAHPDLRPPASLPSALAPETLARYGKHPCVNDDPLVSAVPELVRMGRGLCAGARTRGEIILDLFLSEPTELLVVMFPELHVAGHQFLHLETPGHPCHQPALKAAFGGSPLNAVYDAVDASVGALLAQLPADATVILAGLSNVRVTFGGGARLMEELLLRLGLAVPATGAKGRVSQAWVRLPPAVKVALKRCLPAKLATRAKHDRFRASFDWPATRAVALPWACDGFVRVNLRGREPDGIVEPGAEQDALLTGLETVLRELRIAGTNEPAVRRVVRAPAKFPGQAAADLPDLVVLWNNERPLAAVESPAVGRIEITDRGQRSVHGSEGGLFAYGPGIKPGPPITGARGIDIAPTVLALLGVAAPETIDGHVIGDLLAAKQVTNTPALVARWSEIPRLKSRAKQTPGSTRKHADTEAFLPFHPLGESPAHGKFWNVQVQPGLSPQPPKAVFWHAGRND